AFRQLELAGLRRFLRQLLLHGIAHRDPAALGARHRALDQDEAALDIGLHDLEIERRHPIDAHVARHLLVLEGLARILTAAGRTDRTVRDRHAVRCTQAAEIPALHAAGKALADRRAANVHELPDHEMIGGDLGANRDQRIVGHAEFGKLALRLDLGLREEAAVRLDHVVGTTRASTELQRDVAVLVLGAMADDLTRAEAQHRHRHMLTGIGEYPGHSDLLRDHSGTHVLIPHPALELDLDVDAGGKVELHQRVHRLRRRIDDVQETLVRAHLELFAARLIDVRRAIYSELLDARR